MEYNSQRPTMLMREYGRHVQSMVEYLPEIEDRSKRLANAESIVELMGFLNPGLKAAEDYKQKLWDHLYYMSNFELDVDGPYEKPTAETYHKKPEPLSYPKHGTKYSHLGRNIEKVIEKGMAETDPEKKSGFAHTIAHYMKLAYSTWHKELMHDDAIRQELNIITNGELEFTNTPYVRHRAAPFVDESAYPKRSKYKQNNRPRSNNGGNSGNSNNRNSQSQSGGNKNRNTGGKQYPKKRY